MPTRVCYNITGFTDLDFSKADFTACGPFIQFSLKFDQVSGPGSREVGEQSMDRSLTTIVLPGSRYGGPKTSAS